MPHPLNNPPPSNDAPLEAYRFAADVELPADAAGDASAPIPITVKARSNQAIEHWFWGRIVHDMSGMFTVRETIPFDYNHDAREVLGPCTKQDATDEGLVCSGSLVPFTPDDRVNEIRAKAKHGTPYEASINWAGDGVVFETVDAGTSAPVNGYDFAGPGLIVRKWPLRGVAICPYGADAYTETLFKRGAPGARPPHHLFSEGTMPVDQTTDQTTTDETKTDETKAESEGGCDCAQLKAQLKALTDEAATDETTTEEPPPVKELSAHQKEGQRFVKAFGSQGAAWYLDGKSFDEAQQLHNQGQQQQFAAIADENTQLKKSIEALRGEKNPLNFGGENDTTKQTKEFAGDNVSKIASTIKLPGRRK